MLDLMNLASPKGQWLRTLSEAWDQVLPLATDALKTHGAYEADAIEETTAEWFKAHPQAVADAAVLIALGQHDGAKAALVASLQVFFKLAPEWAAVGFKSPTRAQVLYQWTGGRHDNVLAAEIDGMRTSDLRQVARQHLRAGKVLPERSAEDHGQP